MIVAAVLVPLATLGLFGIAGTLPHSALVSLFMIAALCGLVAVIYTTSDLPKGTEHQTTRSYFELLFLLPLMLGSLALSLAITNMCARYIGPNRESFGANWAWVWRDALPWSLKFSLASACIWGAIIHTGGIIVGALCRRQRLVDPKPTPPTNYSDTKWGLVKEKVESYFANLGFRGFGAAIASGALAGGVAWLTVRSIVIYSIMHGFGAGPAPSYGVELLATLAFPTVLVLFQVGTVAYVALIRDKQDDGPREWWGRAGGEILLIMIVWLVAFGVVVWLPIVVIKIIPWVASIGGAGGVLSLVGGYLGSNSKGSGGEAIKSAWASAFDKGIVLLAGLFVVALLVGVSLSCLLLSSSAGTRSAPNSLNVLNIATSHLGHLSLALIVSTVAFCLTAWAVGVNTFSLHSLYGNRLIRAYLGATRQSGAPRKPHAFTGFDPKDDLPLSDLTKSGPLKHILNGALNITLPDREHLEWQQRKAASFVFTSEKCGSSDIGAPNIGEFCQTNGFADSISLGRAMSISGAAASPNMGYHSSPLVSFVLAFFNVRLGAWLPNPRYVSKKSLMQRVEPRWGLRYTLAELLGQATDSSRYVYLSDGGHFENLGLYEMIRERCKTIVAVDASGDPAFSFEDLENCVRKCRTDLGASVAFTDGLPNMKCGMARAHWAAGTISYREGGTGTLIYIKPVLTGDEPQDVLRYAQRSRATGRPFPHHSTADQFFDEAQFESYRMLGLHSLEGIPEPWSIVKGPTHFVPEAGTDGKAAYEAESDVGQQIAELVGRAREGGWSLAKVAGAAAAVLAVPSVAHYIVLRQEQSPHIEAQQETKPQSTERMYPGLMPAYPIELPAGVLAPMAIYPVTFANNADIATLGKSASVAAIDLDRSAIPGVKEFARRLPEVCAPETPEEKFVLNIEGFASSQEFLNKDTGKVLTESNQLNVEASNKRGAALFAKLKETWPAERLGVDTIEAVVFHSYREMLNHRPYINRVAVISSEDQQRLNRRAEVWIYEAGSCTSLATLMSRMSALNPGK